MIEKICITCNEKKSIDQFTERKDSKDGYKNTCKKCDSIRWKKWKLLNIEKVKHCNKVYAQNNKEKISKRKNKWFNDKMKSDPLFNLRIKIRNSIKDSFRGTIFYKKNRTVEILGCSFEEFKLYLELQFDHWMNFDNYGKYNGEFNFGWDIDHIIPTSSAKTEEEIIKLNHYTNLKPLCSKINRDIKRNNINYYENMSI